MVERNERYKNTGPSPRMLRLVHKLALTGLTDKQMADVLEINIKTFEYWKTRHFRFRDAIHKGKDIADANVAKALYRKAVGFWVPDVHIMSNRIEVLDENGKVIETRTEPLIVNIKKYIPPDYNAANKWLSVRQKAIWADVQKIEVNHIGNINIKQIADQLSDKRQFTTDEIRMALRLSMANIVKNGQQLALDN